MASRPTRHRHARLSPRSDGAGRSKQLLELKQVDDFGANVDEVWHFVKGRAYGVAQSYFGCADNASWLGLPLMGPRPPGFTSGPPAA